MSIAKKAGLEALKRKDSDEFECKEEGFGLAIS